MEDVLADITVMNRIIIAKEYSDVAAVVLSRNRMKVRYSRMKKIYDKFR